MDMVGLRKIAKVSSLMLLSSTLSTGYVELMMYLIEKGVDESEGGIPEEEEVEEEQGQTRKNVVIICTVLILYLRNVAYF